MEQPPRRSWWGRNWKWLVPVFGLVPVLVACIFLLVFGMFKSSDVYAEALGSAKANEEVKAALGEPVEAGYWVVGSLKQNGLSGRANLKIPLAGPKGSGTLYVKATKADDRWQYSTLEVVPEATGARIDLLPKPRP
jgi:hypothetical protein